MRAESNSRRRLLILSGLWLSVLVVLVAFRNVVLPFAGAGLIAYLVAPLVDRISGVRIGQRSLPRWGAILLIYVLFFLVVYLAILALVPQLYRELARISRDVLSYANGLTPARISELTDRAEAWLLARNIPLELSSRSLEGDPEPVRGVTVDLEQTIHHAIARFSETLRESFGNIVALSRLVVTRVLAGVFMLFFILMVAAFFSIDAAKISSYAHTLIPVEYGADARLLFHRIDRALSGVVRGQVTICVVNGVLTFIGLVLFGVKFALLLATIATLLSLIPIFGTIISSVPIVLIGLSQSWKTGLSALLWIIGIHALEAYVLNPKIMGDAAKVHPVVVAFALIAGERTFGLWGALFAVPLAAIFVACFDFARQKANA